MDINEPVPKTVKNIPKCDKPEVLEATEMGIQCPRWCNRCSNCSDYSISAQHLTRKELAELLQMVQKMLVEAENKRMVLKYPIVKDPSVLSNNFQQAVKMASSLEKRLKTKRDLYKQCIQEFIDRPCMREIP